MIPTISMLTEEIIETTYPTRTYKISINANANQSQENTGSDDASILGVCVLGKMVIGKTDATVRAVEFTPLDRINGYVDDLDAVKQAIYLILNTERYKHLIYSWDYGVELIDLIGKPIPYVLSELPRRIKEALIQDNRISDVTGFEFENVGKAIHVKFNVITNVGNISTELEVEV